MLGAVICPACATPQAADLSHATSACRRCGRRIDLRRSKIFFSSESHQEVAEAVRRLSERNRDVDSNEPRDVPPRPVSVSNPRLAVETCGREFCLEDLAAWSGLPADAAERVLDQLLREGAVVQVSRDRYKAVD